MFKTFKEYPEGTIDVVSNSRIGRYMHLPKAIESHFNNKLPKKIVMLDVACGAAADHPLIYDFFDQKKVKLILIGLDINKDIIEHTLKGKIAYGLEVGNILKNNNLCFKNLCQTDSEFEKYYSYNNIYDYFDLYKRKPFDKVVDLALNKKGEKWIMNEKSRERLDMRLQDATNLEFEDNYADVVVCENFLFGRDDKLGDLIRSEMKRVLKPEGYSYFG